MHYLFYGVAEKRTDSEKNSRHWLRYVIGCNLKRNRWLNPGFSCDVALEFCFWSFV